MLDNRAKDFLLSSSTNKPQGSVGDFTRKALLLAKRPLILIDLTIMIDLQVLIFYMMFFYIHLWSQVLIL